MHGAFAATGKLGGRRVRGASGAMSACGPSEAQSRRAKASGGGTPRALNNASVEIEVARRFGDRLVFGLSQRFFEPLRQRITFRTFSVERLLERGLAPCLLVGKDALRVRELDVQPRRRLAMRDHPAEVEIDDQYGVAAGTNKFALRLEACRIFLSHRAIIPAFRLRGCAASADRSPYGSRNCFGMGVHFLRPS